jgi:hypothetical protein
MALFSRRSRSGPASSADEDDFDDFDDLPEETPASSVAPSDLPPNRLREWEIPTAYGVAAVVAILAVLELVVTKGAGAKSPEPLLPIIGLVLIAAQAATIRLANRLLTSVATILAALAVFYDNRIPKSLTVPRLIGFLAAFLFAFLVIQRHSRAQRALAPPRGSRRGAATSSNARGGRGKKTAEPTGVPASRRYTPPKPKVDPNAKKRR